jgi:hypothetical protein
MSAKEKEPKQGIKANTFIRKEKVIPKWHVGESTLPVEAIQSQSVKGALGIVIALPGHVRSVSIHRPIGQSGLEDDDWVITPTGEVTELLSRQEDPDGKKIEVARQKFSEEYLISAGCFERNATTGLLHYAGMPVKSRRDILKTANAAQKSDPKGSYLEHLPTECAEIEERARILKDSSAFKEELGKAIPNSSFITASGPFSDRPQRAAARLKGKTAEQVADIAYRAIFDLSTGTHGVPVPPSGHGDPPRAAKLKPGATADAVPPTSGKKAATSVVASSLTSLPSK